MALHNALPWLIGGGTLAAAGAFFWFGRKFLGTKWAAIGAGIIAAFGLFQSAQAKARAQGRKDAAADQERKNLDLKEKADAERARIEKLQHDDPTWLPPDDPNDRSHWPVGPDGLHHDPRSTG